MIFKACPLSALSCQEVTPEEIMLGTPRKAVWFNSGSSGD
jgi:hypothetical protein